MYSNNDYRYYLEHRLMESDDFLAHYGVKGMKWKNHKLGVRELNTVINRDQEAFYARNSQDANRALRQKRVAQKAYNRTLLGRADRRTNGLITSPYRIMRNNARAKAERKSREQRQSIQRRPIQRSASTTTVKRRNHNTTIKTSRIK